MAISEKSLKHVAAQVKAISPTSYDELIGLTGFSSSVVRDCILTLQMLGVVSVTASRPAVIHHNKEIPQTGTVVYIKERIPDTAIDSGKMVQFRKALKDYDPESKARDWGHGVIRLIKEEGFDKKQAAKLYSQLVSVAAVIKNDYMEKAELDLTSFLE